MYSPLSTFSFVDEVLSLLSLFSYNDVEDEHRATNLLITADEAFIDIKVSTLGVSWSSFFSPLSLLLSLSLALLFLPLPPLNLL